MPAPYYDNLYSADSDDEPDAFSPTDGYFHASADANPASASPHSPSSSSSPRSNVPHVPNVFVEDPTLPSRESKAREARSESEQHSHLINSGSAWGCDEPASSVGHGVNNDLETGLAGNTSSSSAPSQARGSLSARSPTHHLEAPPAYTPPQPNNYNTFSPPTMGQPDEHRHLLSHEPESMSNSNPATPSPPSRWQRIKSSIAKLNLRNKIKTTLGFLVVFSVVFMVFSSFTLRPSHKHSDYFDDVPVKKPDMDDGNLQWSPHGGCLDRPHRFAQLRTEVDLRPMRNLSIVQTVDKKDNSRSGWAPHISGSVVLRPAERSSPSIIDLEVITNDAGLGVSIEFDKETQRYTMVTPRRVDWESGSRAPCIQIRVTIHAPLESIVNALSIDTQHFDVDIREGLIFGAVKGAFIRTASGDVRAPKQESSSSQQAPYTLLSRDIYVRTTSGDIKGWYPLYDTLDIQTTSGDITAQVGPMPADPQAVAPAVLRAKSVSGKVAFQEPVDQISSSSRPDRVFPPRDYVVDIITASGDVSADLAVTTHAEFTSQSGDLKINLWPILDAGLLKMEQQGSNPFIETDTKSGDTTLTVLEPLWTSLATVGGTIPPAVPRDRNDPPFLLPPDTSDAFAIADTPALSVLKSKHKSVSGDIRLVYPSSWEGSLYAQTVSGSQTVHGKGLEITKSGGMFARFVKGKKGSGHSELNVESVSGDQDVLIGK